MPRGRKKGSKATAPLNRGVLWLAVTNDKYELPIAVALSQRELGELLKTDHTNISKTFRVYGRQSSAHMQYLVYKVEIGKKEFKELVEAEINS